MKKTGEILRKAREEKNLSIHEIGIALKISNKVIKAIEEGDNANLPQAAFLRGFVKSYSQFLKLNQEQVMLAFTEEMGLIQSAPPTALKESADLQNIKVPAAEISSKPEFPKSSDKSPIESINDPNRKNIWPLLITVVMLIGAIAIVKKVIDRYSKETVTDSLATIDESQEKPLNNSVLSEASPTPSESSVAATPSPSATASVTPTVTPTSIASASPSSTKTTSEPVVIPSGINEVISATSGATSAAIEKSEDSEEKKPVQKNLVLIVEALDSLDIEYSAGGGKTQSLHLEPLQVHTFKSEVGLKLSLSNAGAANLTLNGKDLGIPGELGKPKKLSY